MLRKKFNNCLLSGFLLLGQIQAIAWADEAGLAPVMQGSGTDSGVDSQFAGDLSTLENKLYSHDFASESVPTRLDRIERLIYGSAKTGSTADRMNQLLIDVHMKSSSPSPSAPAQPATYQSAQAAPYPSAQASPYQGSQPAPYQGAQEDPYQGETPVNFQNGQAGQSTQPTPYQQSTQPAPYQQSTQPAPYQQSAQPAPYQQSTQPAPYQTAQASPNQGSQADPYQGTQLTPYGTGAAQPAPYQSAQTSPYQGSQSDPYQGQQSPYQQSGQPSQYGQATAYQQNETPAAYQQYAEPVTAPATIKGPQSPSSLKAEVSKMEKQVFGQNYSKDTLTNRVTRLEQSVLASQPAQTFAPLPTRVANLMAALQPQFAHPQNLYSGKPLLTSSKEANTSDEEKQKQGHPFLKKLEHTLGRTAMVLGPMAGSMAGSMAINGMMNGSMMNGGYGGFNSYGNGRGGFNMYSGSGGGFY